MPIGQPSSLPTALVTGAGRGIGLGIATALAHAGYRVALSDIDEASAARSASHLSDQGFPTLGVWLDVSQADAWARAVAEVTERWGGLDLLVNNAGISPRGTVESTDEALWDRTLAINLKGPWFGIKTALPWLQRRRGTIVNIGSTRATRPMPGLFSYVTSKAGLLGLTRQVAVETLGQGVTCNMVAPGWVDTPGERLIQAEQGRPEFPQGVSHLTTAEDVGGAVVFLASPAGRKANGVILYLDSGLHIADDAGMVYLPHEKFVRYHQPTPNP
ncbi:3-oxoacyl-[acyl-carrier protein] reductase [Singulisphaera sp. GP187]|uniref:SDR family NAD(P)-dependent oxidoreductase n=1 Tax=Singulisphaera sp. GP187 TaxID=1882752 RepID=UPI000927D7EE|nr:SDR family oxidoreductase [Singulisphaera sp. GP187]SIO67341.1 3-oxoacyl-[acyl-carrier protein] reductase [Singulisphaera sp. GP187]